MQLSIEAALAVAGSIVAALGWLFKLQADGRLTNQRLDNYMKQNDREMDRMRTDFNITLSQASRDPRRHDRLRPLSRSVEGIPEDFDR